MSNRSVRILVESPDLTASVRVGVLRPLAPLVTAGECETRFKKTADITRADIRWSDVIVSVRGCEYASLRIVHAAKEAGRFAVYFLDDDLLHIPHGNASTNYYSDYMIQEYLSPTLSCCDILCAVNTNILAQYGKQCARTALSRVPVEILRKPPENTPVTHVLYAGSVDHGALVQEKLSPAVRRLRREYPDRIDFTFIGADPKIKGDAGVRFFPFFDSYDAYQSAVLGGGYSIGLAPMYHTPFYACKYYNKFIEYASFGIAGIYENCAPYTDIVIEDNNGFFAGESADDWYQAIAALLPQQARIREAAENAQRLIQSAFSGQEIANRLRTDIPELTSFYAPDIQENEIRLPSMRWLFYKERMQLLFKMHGVWAVFVILWRAIRKVCKMIGNME